MTSLSINMILANQIHCLCGAPKEVFKSKMICKPLEWSRVSCFILH
jgi:hypothetical protein